MQIYRVILPVLFLSLGCTTPYQRMGVMGGYESSRLSKGHYSVHVRVNSSTSSGTAFNYLNRRAQELCKSEGYSSFQIETGSEHNNYFAYKGQVKKRPEITALIRCTGLPSRPKWWCSVTATVTTCSKAKEMCDKFTWDYRQMGPTDCAPQNVAWCFSSYSVKGRNIVGACSVSLNACSAHRASILQDTANFAQVAECIAEL